MADTNHIHATPPVEGDGISYRGILWFLVILTATTLFCQVLVWGMFRLMESRAASADAPRAPTAAPAGNPSIETGRVVTGTDNASKTGLLVSEPISLEEFRRSEQQALTTYAIDRNTGAIRIPIERAKALILERGLSARPAGTAGASVSAAAAPAPARSAGVTR
jgi:hypothetical protein